MSSVSISSSSSTHLDFIVFRHGQTQRNPLGLIQGQKETVNTQLTFEGIEQIASLGMRLYHVGITKIYTSDLARCKQSAIMLSHYSKEAKVVVRKGLKGIDHGDNDGMNFMERNQRFEKHFSDHNIHESQDPFAKWKSNPMKGPETVYEVWERAHENFINIAKENFDKIDGKVFSICSDTTQMQTMITYSNYVFGKAKKLPLPIFFELKEPLKNSEAVRFRYHPEENGLDKAIEFIGFETIGEPTSIKSELPLLLEKAAQEYKEEE